MNVLVVGGTGFISSRLVDFLVEDGHTVTTLTRGRTPVDDILGVERLFADRADTFRVGSVLSGARFDAAYDFAAYAPDDTRSIVQILEGKVDRFIHCSTISVYMIARDLTYPISEDQDQVPVMPHWPRNPFGMEYGILKRRCEDVLWEAHERGRLQVSMLRPPFVCGPRDPTNRDFFWIERILDGKPLLVPGHGDFAFQTVFVDDVARAFSDLLGHPASIGQAYNVAADEIMTLNSYLKRLGDMLDREPVLIHVPQSVFERQPFSINPRGDVFPFNTQTTAIFSLEAIRRDLSYASTPFDEWMPKTIRWYAAEFGNHSIGYDLRDEEVAFALSWRDRMKRFLGS